MAEKKMEKVLNYPLTKLDWRWIWGSVIATGVIFALVLWVIYTPAGGSNVDGAGEILQIEGGESLNLDSMPLDPLYEGMVPLDLGEFGE